MTRSIARATLTAAALVAGTLACGGTQGGRTDYAKDGDTGAAAPATVITPDQKVDSTTGLRPRGGSPATVGASAGDTLGPQGRAASPLSASRDSFRAQRQRKP